MIPEWAGEYVGLEYEAHGRGPTRFDCWGFVRHVYRNKFDIDLPAFDELYADEAEISEALSIARDEERPYFPVALEDAKEGDVVFFASVRDVLHTAVMLDRVHFIHCNSHTIYSTIERIDNPLWRNRVIEIYRHRNIEGGEH